MTICDHWDCGWCFHEEGPETGCVGFNDCPVDGPREVNIPDQGQSVSDDGKLYPEGDNRKEER